MAVICARCGGAAASMGVGRPRKYCRTCTSPTGRPKGRRAETFPCAWCGQQFTRGGHTRTTYCGRSCYLASRPWRRFELTKMDLPTPLVVLRQCLFCGQWLLKPHGQAFCPGGVCSYRYSVNWRDLTCGICGATYQGNSHPTCPRCRLATAHGSHWASRSKRQRIAVRDEWTCWLCGDGVTKSDWSLDHVLPRALGGTHDDANLRLAHRLCNSLRGARVGEFSLPIAA